MSERAETESTIPIDHAYRLVPDPAQPHAFAPVVLGPGVATVGRIVGCDLILQGDLVSRRHAKIIVSDIGLTIHDLDSHNGLFINGEKIRSANVKVGDKVYFGNVCAHVQAADASDIPSTASLTESNLIRAAQNPSASADPAVRSFQTLCQATDLLLTESDEIFFNEVVRLIRELTNATFAAILRPETKSKLQPIHVAWANTTPNRHVPSAASIVGRCFSEQVALFTKGDKADPVLEAEDLGAALVVPLVSGGRSIGVIFVGRATAQGFLERIVETVSSVAHLVSIRMTGFVTGTDISDETAIRIGSDTAEGDQSGSAERAHLRAELDSTNNQLLTARQTAKTIEAELQRLRREEVARNEEMQRLQRSLEDAEADRKEISAALEEARSQVGQAREGANAQAAAQMNDLGATNQALRAESEAHKERSRGAEQEVARLTAALTDLQAAGDDATKERDELQSNLDALTASRDRLQDELTSAASEHRSLQESRLAAEDARLVAEGEIEQLRQEIASSNAELEHLRQTFDSVEASKAKAAEAAEEASHAGAKKVLSIVRDLLPTRSVARIASAASGETAGRDLQMGPATIVAVNLQNIDIWVQAAAPDRLASRLDVLCQSIRVLASANGGELVQVLGAQHLLSFGGDAEGVRNALTCAREISLSIPNDDSGGVQVGIHTGAALSGFFGDETGASFLHVGEAVLAARGASDFAPPGAVWVTETVRAALGADSEFLLIATGPHLIRGYANPFNLFQLGAPA